MTDQLLRVLSQDGFIRASFATTTALVREVCHHQGTDPTATVALGRLTTAAALMGSLLKGKQRLGLTIEGNGPLQKLQAETDANGLVRGTIKTPVCNLPPVNDRFDVPGAIGKAGFLHVIKDLGLKEPYRGMVQLCSSEIAEDLAHYFSSSEQTPTSVALGVTLDQQGEVAASGGFFIQAMPDCDDDYLKALEQTLSSLPAISTLIREGLSAQQIADRVMTYLPYTVQATCELKFHCNCSRRHVLAMLGGLDAKELNAMAEQNEDTEVVCEYCKKAYLFTPAEIANLAAAKK